MPLDTTSLHTLQAAEFARFASRRSVVHSNKGIVSCTQPLAANCGLKVLQAGGNAADAAVATAAGLNMTEPCSTGIGGDMFMLYYDAKTGKVSAMNGSGRAGAQCTLDRIRGDLGLKDGETGSADGKIPMSSVHAVTVPGAPAGWCDTVDRFGSGNLKMDQILAPAIELGENGFPVSEVASFSSLRNASPNFAEMLKKDPAAKDGVRAPRPGEITKNPNLAATFRALAAEGKAGFYKGRIAEELVKVVTDLGGHMQLDDLQHHLETGSEDVEPISLKVEEGLLLARPGVELWEHPPNGQGIVALMTLGILQELRRKGTIPQWGPGDHNTAPYLHAIIEGLRLAFTDAQWYVTDPNVETVPSAGLVSSPYLEERSQLFDPNQAMASSALHEPGKPPFGPSPALNSSDTVYFAVADAEGNAASFINSNYAGFGTSIVPHGCGFTLQNRGANFNLDPAHPNRLAPRKRPYHTIIPGMATNLADGSLFSAFGVMGGFMQPQGHVQVLLGQLIGGLDPQQALDSPRVCIDFNWTVSVEEGMPEETVKGLRKLGHDVKVVKGTDRGLFGRGQIIRRHVDPVEKTGTWSAGSDPRGDGGAYPGL